MMKKTFIFVVLAFTLGCAKSELAKTFLREFGYELAPQGVEWGTSFDCGDWDQSMGGGDAQVCLDGDSVTGRTMWATAAGARDQIIAAANNPSGLGGKGFRHWRSEPSQPNRGGLKINLPAVLPELWVRWHMRYQAGFAWIGNAPQFTEEIHFNPEISNVFSLGFRGANTWGASAASGNFVANRGWQDIMGGNVSDGNWHAYEAHVKMDTNGANGIAEFWVDGVLAQRSETIDWGTGIGWGYFIVGGSQCCVDNGGADMYVDYDDIRVSTQGYITP